METSKSSVAAAVVELLKVLGTAMAAASALALNHRCSLRHQVVSDRHSGRDEKISNQAGDEEISNEMEAAWLRNAPASSEQGRWLRPTPGRSAVTPAVGSASRLRRRRCLRWFHRRGQATRVKSVS